MKNLTYIGGDEIARFKALVSSKNKPTKPVLLAAIASINNRLAAYEQASQNNSLALLDATPSDLAAIADELKSCYLSSTTSLKETKVAILKAQPSALRGTCQFCGINENLTFDHYVPKEEFPEFSSMALNLMPMCGHCNLRKGVKWREMLDNKPTGNRTIINLYSDDLPKLHFLICKVAIEDDVPVATFSFHFDAGIPKEMETLIREHYKQLNLLTRFGAKSDSPIGEIVVPKHSDPMVRRNLLQDSLRESALQWRDKFGHNYWKSALYSGLADSPSYLDWAVSQ